MHNQQRTRESVTKLQLCFCLAVALFGQLRANAQVFLVESSKTFLTLNVVTLAWNPSPDSGPVRYFLRWGLSISGCTNQFDVGNKLTAVIGGLRTDVCYVFQVVAYDGVGNESPPSNQIEYTPRSRPKLNLSLDNKNPASGLTLSFNGNPGNTYSIEATEDLVHWQVIRTTNCATRATMSLQFTDVATYPRRFYRVAGRSNSQPNQVWR